MNSPAPLLKISNLSARYGTRVVLDEVSFGMRQGEVVAIMGPSGSGKTTLLRSVNGLTVPSLGCVELGDTRVDYPLTRVGKKGLQRIRSDTAMVFQNFNLFPHRTVLENVVEGAVYVKGLDKREANERGLALLDLMGLKDRAQDYPSRLSGGQKQRVAIARGLAVKPALMLFDEPTSALDPALRSEVLGAMRELARTGMTMLIVTHESQFALDVADRIIFVAEGRIQADEPPAFYRQNDLPDVMRGFF